MLKEINVFDLYQEKTPRELLAIALSKLSNYVSSADVKYSVNAGYWIHSAVDIYAYMNVHPRNYLKIVATTRDGLVLEIHWYSNNELYYEIHSLHDCDCSCECGE